MKRFLLLVLLVGMSSLLVAQSITRYVVATTGGDLSSSEGPSLSWTLGEISTENISNGITVQQGFQQGRLELAVGIHNPLTSATTWKVFPNPTDYYLQLETNLTGTWRYELRDVLGRLILYGKSDQPELSIDLPLLTEGIYWITVYPINGLLASKKLFIHQN